MDVNIRPIVGDFLKYLSRRLRQGSRGVRRTLSLRKVKETETERELSTLLSPKFPIC